MHIRDEAMVVALNLYFSLEVKSLCTLKLYCSCGLAVISKKVVGIFVADDGVEVEALSTIVCQ